MSRNTGETWGTPAFFRTKIIFQKIDNLAHPFLR